MPDKSSYPNTFEYEAACRDERALQHGAYIDEAGVLVDDRLIHEDKTPFTVVEMDKLMRRATAGDFLAFETLREAGIEVEK